jgi:hypothetical protein
MTSQFEDFALRHGSCAEPLIVEALGAFADARVFFLSVSTTACADLARIYSIRSGIAASQGRSSHAAACQQVADACAVNAEAACSLWLLEGPSLSFALFELSATSEIIGGFRFQGPISH